MSKVTNRIPAQPPPRARGVIPVSIVKQVAFIVLIFGRKPDGVRLGHRPRSPDDFPERAFEAIPRLRPMSLRM